MPVVQIYLTTSGDVSNPVLIPLSLYGKYKVTLMGLSFISTHANQQFIQFRSRQLLLDFAGSYGAIGQDVNQSLRHPTFLVSGTATASGGNTQITFGSKAIELYTDFNGQFEVHLVDLVDQVGARMTSCMLTLDVVPVDTTFGSDAQRMQQDLAHTFTQRPQKYLP
jgi:hypothetical protein